jgi:hypothetical protein
VGRNVKSIKRYIPPTDQYTANIKSVDKKTDKNNLFSPKNLNEIQQ